MKILSLILMSLKKTPQEGHF